MDHPGASNKAVTGYYGENEPGPAPGARRSRAPAARLSTSARTGVDGGIAPLWSCGAQPLAKSFLTGDGAHMTLWTSVLIHVAALVLNMTANILFFVNSGDTAADLLMGWAISSLVMHTLAVLGTVVSTAFVRDPFLMPLMSTFGIGLFLGGLLATAKISYTHGLSHPADSGENVTYNLSLFFQAFALASVVANSLCALSSKVDF